MADAPRVVDYDRIADRYDRRYELYSYAGVLETLQNFLTPSVAVAAVVTAAVGGRTGPFRGPAEQHPLQHRQLGVHPLQLAVPHGQHLAEFGDLLALLLHQRRQPLVRLKRMGQQTLQADERIRFRECTASCHERQQTPPRSEDHASPAPGVSHREATPTPGANHTTSDYLRPFGPNCSTAPPVPR